MSIQRDEYGLRLPIKNATKQDIESYRANRERLIQNTIDIDEFKSNVISYLEKKKEISDNTRSTNTEFEAIYLELQNAASTKDIHITCMKHAAMLNDDSRRVKKIEEYVSEKDRVDLLLNNIDDTIAYIVRYVYRKFDKSSITSKRVNRSANDEYFDKEDIIEKASHKLYLHLSLNMSVPVDLNWVFTEQVDEALVAFRHINPSFGLSLFSLLSDKTLNDIGTIKKCLKLNKYIESHVYLYNLDYRNTDEVRSKYIDVIDADFTIAGVKMDGVDAVEFCHKYKNSIIYYILASILNDPKYKSQAKRSVVAPIQFYKICELRTSQSTGDSQIKFQLKDIKH